MQQIKLLNGLLWALNGLLGAAIVVFAFLFLLFTDPVDYRLPTEDTTVRGPKPPPSADYSYLRNLGNPVLPKGPERGPAAPNELERVAKLVGIRNKIGELPEAAYLVILASSLGVNAYPEQPIASLGHPVAELRGWTLVRVTESGAVFTNGSREVELRLDSLSAMPVAGNFRGPPGPGDGRPFDPAQSKSRRTAVVEGSHESWVIDRAEIEWANGNLEALLAEVQLSVYSDGGVKIDAPGSLAGDRGFIQNDVIKTVNGRKISDRTDLINLANSPDFRRAGAMVVVVERAGKPYTLDFRPDFQRGPR